MNGRKTDAERIIRRQKVVEMILQGFLRRDIVIYGKENWNIESRTVDNLLAEAREDLKKSLAITKEENIDLAKARFSDLYQKNYSEKDYKECRAVQEAMNKMLGLNEAEKMDLTTKGEMLPTVNVYNTAPPLSNSEEDINV